MEDLCDNNVLAANSANLLFQLNRKIPIRPNAQWARKVTDGNWGKREWRPAVSVSQLI